MQNINQILVIIDPTAVHQPGFDRAIEICKRSGADLRLLICDRDPVQQGRLVASEKGLENARAALEEKHRQQLDQLTTQAASELETDPASIATSVRWDYPLADAILHEIEEQDPDLVIKETHHHGPVSRVLFSNTDRQLIQACAKPLWLVKSEVSMSPPRIVAAVARLNPSDANDSLDHRILLSAMQLTAELGGKLHVFHAYDVPNFGDEVILGGSGAAIPQPSTAMLHSSHGLAADTESEHRKAIEQLLRDCSIDDAELTLRAGLPSQSIIDFADEIEASLVVMGASSRSTIERVLLGSTAEHALDRVPSDLLVVKQAA